MSNILLSVDTTYTIANGGSSSFFTLAGIASTIAVCVALWTFNRTTRMSVMHTQSSIILQCLQRYLDVLDYKSKAIIEKHPEHANQYWRGMLDLLWTEYYLWKKGYIDDSNMHLWCSVRRGDYVNDSSVAIPDSGNILYKSICQDLISKNYFQPDDQFRRFLDEIHNPEIELKDILARHKKSK